MSPFRKEMKTTNDYSIPPLFKPAHPIGETPLNKVRISRGDIVRGHVVQSLPPRHAIMSIRGERVLAETQMVLKQGDVVSLRVQQVSPQTILQVVNQLEQGRTLIHDFMRWGGVKGGPYRHIADLLTLSIGAGKEANDKGGTESVVRIGRRMQALSLMPGSEETPQRVGRWLRDCGLMWEGKLKSLLAPRGGMSPESKVFLDGDLKRLVLTALFNSRESEMVGSESLRQFLEGLEQLQLANVSAMESRGRCLFVIPIEWNDELRFAQLLMEVPKESEGNESKESKKNAYRICLLLDMSNLGTIQAEASILKKAVRVSFLVSDEGLRKRFEAAVPRLTGTLESQGFSVQQVKCRSVGTSQTLSSSLVDEILDEERHHISLVV
jgi:hypothetical protein